MLHTTVMIPVAEFLAMGGDLEPGNSVYFKGNAGIFYPGTLLNYDEALQCWIGSYSGVKSAPLTMIGTYVRKEVYLKDAVDKVGKWAEIRKPGYWYPDGGENQIDRFGNRPPTPAELESAGLKTDTYKTDFSNFKKEASISSSSPTPKEYYKTVFEAACKIAYDETIMKHGLDFDYGPRGTAWVMVKDKDFLKWVADNSEIYGHYDFPYRSLRDKNFLRIGMFNESFTHKEYYAYVFVREMCGAGLECGYDRKKD